MHRRVDPLDAYVRGAQDFIDSGQFDRDEGYKIEIADQLHLARQAVVDGGEWPSLVRKGLVNNLTGGNWRARDVVTDWFSDERDSARQALRALWTDSGVPIAERIRIFLAQVPDSGKFKGTGTRLRVVAVLLMALGPHYPPYKRTEFEEAYKATNHPQPPATADEGQVYAHALAFLDEILERTRALGFERPANRLEAQSVVWMMSGEPAEEPSGKEVEHDPDASPKPNLGALAEELLLEPRDFLGDIDLLLTEKRQVIFQGPPGTGKTYVARELARALAGSVERVRLVQFHPSYAYEDFVQGYRPTLKDGQAGFELRDGPLVQMAEQAQDAPSEKHFLVIDEINRGNLAKVFGELYFLLEYRGPEHAMQLQYSDKRFSLPDNLYIIGTMNTADRSIALVDLALRRRFSFVEFHPEKAPVEGLLGRWLERKEIDMPWLAKVVDLANTKLDNREAAIGPSYFMKDDLDEERVGRIWEHDVLPYIEEQLYGQHERLAEFDIKTLRREAEGNEGSSEQSATPESDNEED